MYRLLKIRCVNSTACFILSAFVILFQTGCALSHAGNHTALTLAESGQSRDERIKEAVHLVNLGKYDESEKILLVLAADELWQKRADILLGRVYTEQGLLDKAKFHLKRAVSENFILRDYVHDMLAGIYLSEKNYEKAINAAGKIKNKTLLQKAKQHEIIALLEINKDKAIKALKQYTGKYKQDWEHKQILAELYKDSGKEREAVRLLKEIYISASPPASEALTELTSMKADKLIQKEAIERAGNLFKTGDFAQAEIEYTGILEHIKDPALSEKIRFKAGVSQFNQKKYDAAAENFRLIETPKAMYWMARALFRIKEFDRFRAAINSLETTYPGNEYLAKLLLAQGDKARRDGKLSEAEDIYKRVVKSFPKEEKDALWSLGWMHYTNRRYSESLKYFSELASGSGNKDRDKYRYWETKTREIITNECLEMNAGRGEQAGCPEKDSSGYTELSKNRGYYGFLSRLRNPGSGRADKIEITMPAVPNGIVYARIEILKSLGMNREAAEEIKSVLTSVRDGRVFKYLAFTAIEIGEYNRIIYFAEGIEDEEFLPLSFPRGFPHIVEDASRRENVDAYLIMALIREESRFDPEASSIAGASGLMQLMPATAQRMRRKLNMDAGDDFDIYSVKANISLGTHYLSLLIREFKEIPLAIAAYNAGERAVRKWLAGSKHRDIEEFIEDIPYRETRKYVKKVLRSYWQYRAIEGLPMTEGGE